MDVFIFSDNKNIYKRFSALDRSQIFNLSQFTIKEARSILKKATGPVLAYIDVDGLESGEQLTLARYLGRLDTVRFGILDSRGSVSDVGALFHSGAVDYLGKVQLKESIGIKRVESALDYEPFESDAIDDGTTLSPTAAEWILSGKDWKNVRSGGEYTFCFLLIELDLIKEWRLKSGRAHLNEVVETFHQHIEKVFSPLNGKVWMWTEYGGLILFPFDGKRCNTILTCLKLVLNRTIISAEEYSYNTLISYRMALHIGNTVYKAKGKTGNIVSNSLNFIFHLLKQFAEPGNLYLTEAVIPFVPKGLESCFIEAGSFEEIPLHKMRLPLKRAD